MTKFGNILRKLLLEKLASGELTTMTKDEINEIKVSVQCLNEEWGWIIDEKIHKKIPEEIIEEISALWMKDLSKYIH